MKIILSPIMKHPIIQEKRKKNYDKRFIFKIEQDVRAEFLRCCAKRGESAGQVLREHIKRILRDERLREKKEVQG